MLVNNFTELQQVSVTAFPFLETVLTLHQQTAFTHVLSDLFIYCRPFKGLKSVTSLVLGALSIAVLLDVSILFPQ